MAKKIPLRKCVACQQMFSKKELLRVVKTPEDKILIDQSGKQNGRGAYICKNIQCFEKAEKTKALARSLDCEITPEIYAELKEALAGIE
ncbi:YlxR family protein [Clostridiales bacterium COT073_COT-073]|nr:YlxR family protein [Clostridiales bacterium COT073_COT-073]